MMDVLCLSLQITQFGSTPIALAIQPLYDWSSASQQTGYKIKENSRKATQVRSSLLAYDFEWNNILYEFVTRPQIELTVPELALAKRQNWPNISLIDATRAICATSRQNTITFKDGFLGRRMEGCERVLCGHCMLNLFIMDRQHLATDLKLARCLISQSASLFVWQAFVRKSGAKFAPSDR